MKSISIPKPLLALFSRPVFFTGMIGAALFFVFGLSSCKKEEQVDDPVILEAKTEKDVEYGGDPKYKMDIYLPEGRNERTTPVMIMIHGGAWMEGDKADLNPFIDELKIRLPDYAIFNINYRLYDQNSGANRFPTQENDVRAAVSYIMEHRKDYHVSDKVVLLGASAGAHLSLLQGYKYNSEVKVQAIVDFFGPTDMKVMYESPTNVLLQLVVLYVMGGTPDMLPDLYRESSPINYVDAQSPPTIILHGGTDQLVKPSQATALRDKLQEKGVTHEYVFYPNEGHGWTGDNLDDSFTRITTFLKNNVH
ncbi:MAG: alpha/beta hydrolase [Chitinophagaceae bacterium]|nr:alpha/beta hydrolase [Chitinophagaceae bacterium]